MPRKKFRRAFLDVMTARVIDDLKIKMDIANRTPPDKLVQLFFEMCSIGRELFVQSEQEKFPNKSRKDIILDYYRMQNQLSNRRR
jgi:hypothetical protein